MNTVFHISAIILMLAAQSCGSSNKDLAVREHANARYEEMAFRKFGPGTEFLFNEKRTAVLCLKKSKPTSGHPQQQVHFFVFDLSRDTTIFEDEIVNGAVAWKDNSSVLVKSVPGIVKSDEPSPAIGTGYIFDVRTGKTKNLDATNVQ